MLKAYKYRLYPNSEQKHQFAKHFGHSRFVYNWALNRRQEEYNKNDTSLSYTKQAKELTQLKKDSEHSWLNNVNSQTLQYSLQCVDKAFTGFFRHGRGYPNIKSKKYYKQTFHCPQFVSVNFDNNTIKLPKISPIKIILHRPFIGKIKDVTITKTKTDKYFASILVDTPEEKKEKPNTISKDNIVGLDLGLIDFLVTSQGNKIPNPKHINEQWKKIKKLHRNLSRKEKGSNNWEKARYKLAKAYEKVTNQRNDFLHKLSKAFIDENQVDGCAIEDLNIQGMMQNRKLSKAIGTTSWSTFIRFLKYKAEWYGKYVIQIGRFEPSTKLCNHCGYYNNNLTLKDRKWSCPQCNNTLDRDINAAKNIKQMVLQRQNLIGQGLSELTLVKTATSTDQSQPDQQVVSVKQEAAISSELR